MDYGSHAAAPNTVTDGYRLVRPHPGRYGSREFINYLRRVRAASEPRGVVGVDPNSDDSGLGRVEFGVYESDADDGYVNVRIDRTGELMRAEFGGFLPEHRLEVGDELSIELVAGAWRTMPEVRHTIRHLDRIQFWSVNRITGGLRLLAESYYE